MFDPQGMMFFPTLFACLGVTAVLFIAGTAWDLWNKFRCPLRTKGTRREISRELTALNTFCDHSRRLKYYISKKKLQELESKIEDVNQTLNLIKEGITFEKRKEDLSRV